MPTMPCPSCQQLLAFRDEHQGQRVQCSRCGTVLQIPSEPLAPPPVRVAPAPAPEPAGAPFDFAGPQGGGDAEPGPFGFDEERRWPGGDEEDRARARARRQVNSAATWLTGGALIGLALAIIFSLLVLMGMGAALENSPGGGYLVGSAIGAVVLVVVMLVPFTFMLIGAQQLRRRASYGLALTGVIFAGLIGLVGLVPSLLLLIGFVRLLGAVLAFWSPTTPTTPDFCMLVPVGLVLAVVGGLTLFSGGGAIKGLLALTNPDVAESFGGQLRQRLRERSEWDDRRR
jgi:hypothetical protein